MFPENLLGPPLACQDVVLTAVSVVGSPHQQKTQRQLRKKASKQVQSGNNVSIRPCLVAGISVSPSTVASRRTNLDLVWGGGSDIISSPMVRAMNDVNEASNRESAALDIMKVREVDSSGNSDQKVTNQTVAVDRKKSLFLVVYDFHYHNHSKEDNVDNRDDGGGGGKSNSGQAGNSAKKVVSGTGTSASSGTRQENNNMYQEIFLSKFLYDGPVIEDMDTDIVMAPPTDCLVDGLEFPTASSSGGIYHPPPAIAPPTSGGGTHDASSVNVIFSAINGGLNIPTFPSTSEGSPPLLIKVSRVAKKDSCGGNKNSVDTVGSCQLTKRRDPVVMQCIALPEVYKERRDLSIMAVHPTKDGGHLLVVLGSTDCDSNNVTSVPNNSDFQGNMMFECSDNDSDMDVDVDVGIGNLEMASNVKPAEHNPVESSNSRQNFSFFQESNSFQNGMQMEETGECKRTDVSKCEGSVLLVYSLCFEGEAVKVDETPVIVRDFGACGECPVEVTLLPLLEREDNPDSNVSVSLSPTTGCPQGMAVLVCRDGIVRIVDLSTLKTVSQAVPEKRGTKFVSATYCNSEYYYI